VLAQAVMETEVSSQIGAAPHERSPERSAYRNGYRTRRWDTRVGTIELKIPKLTAGAYFPSLLLPDWGEVAQMPGVPERPVRVSGLLSGMPRFVPVLHLHGRIGWFRRAEDQRIYSVHSPRYMRESGTPIIMLPDPDKAYDSDPVINEIWAQFEQALSRARSVFVLGHSEVVPGSVEIEVAALRLIAATPW